MDSRPTETMCQQTIVDAAKWLGWRVHAERPAMVSRRGDVEPEGRLDRWATPIQGHAGFPDLVLIKGPRLLFVELKRKPNHLTEEQIVWADFIAGVEGVDYRLVWVPEEVDSFIEEVLKS